MSLVSINQRFLDQSTAVRDAANQQPGDWERASRTRLNRLRGLYGAVADVVARQHETGLDLVNDGEYGHSMGMKA